MFFVDDSNIWIEAQKFAAKGNSRVSKLIDGDRDPRLRIDIGRLIDRLRGDRNQGASHLYGSRPPPNDLVWKAFERFRFETKIYDRANGKEKEVDNSMATDLSTQATRLATRAEFGLIYEQQRANTTFVVITGDRDMLPPVKRVLECEIAVELWAWESGISREYLKLANRHSLLSVNFLDGIFDDISFTAFQSSRKSEQVDGGQAIVICDLPDLSEVDVDIDGEDEAKGKDRSRSNKKLMSVIGEHLLQIGRLFFISTSQTGLELFIEFPTVKDMDDIIRQVRELGAPELLSSMTVLSWAEHWGRLKKDSPSVVKTTVGHINKFTLLMNNPEELSTSVGAEEGQEPTQRTGNPWRSIAEVQGQQQGQVKEPNDQPWETKSRRGAAKTHMREARKEQRCPSHLRCAKARDCGYSHTEEERNLFRDHPNQDFRFWKTKKCRTPYCRRGKRCRFAHTQEEAWCLRCLVEGHSIEECRYKGERS
ncbi:hypothetical protein B0I35DRAFT_240633 [Stachybotrys elegans]|uniref:C3H1-type domain-containing protein n=1 Tax=Stachybotrys elegans TaxID=80388 RepID=A0A8K0SRJ0_9HYPO|nr:hypothetical protein B0I35DRAFT_240633 [Stachybotrys elegans]